jgi:hypothetical protein
VSNLLRVVGVVVAVLASTLTPTLGQAPAPAPASGVLRVHLRLGPGGGLVAAPRHVLLVSDNPASRAPWRLVVGSDGAGRVTLPPGNYTVESEAPLVFGGKTLEWRQTLDVPAGVDTTLTLTLDNADVGTPPVTTTADGAPKGFDPWDVLIRWQDSVLPLWTPTALASGVVLSPDGLIATNQRVVGAATTVEVQVSPDERVAAHVLASDAARGVAILWADPATLTPRTPVPTVCASAPTLPPGQPVVAIGARPGGQPAPTPGKVRGRVHTGVLVEFDYGVPSTGGPVFSTGDLLVGLTSPPAADDEDALLVTTDAICEALAAARPKMATVGAPSRTPLPAEPAERITDARMDALVKRRTGSLAPTLTTTADFEVAFLTPVTAYAGMRGPMDFANWNGYVATAPPVLLIRVTPKQAERFWTKVARGAAMTQGIALPAFKQFKPGFARLRATCDGKDVIPIHPLVIERPISETAAVREGLYAFAPDALGPACREVRLEVFSEKTPDKSDAVTVEARVREQLAKDFAEYRAALTPAK